MIPGVVIVFLAAALAVAQDSIPDVLLDRLDESFGTLTDTIDAMESPSDDFRAAYLQFLADYGQSPRTLEDEFDLTSVVADVHWVHEEHAASPGFAEQEVFCVVALKERGRFVEAGALLEILTELYPEDHPWRPAVFAHRANVTNLNGNPELALRHVEEGDRLLAEFHSTPGTASDEVLENARFMLPANGIEALVESGTPDLAGPYLTRLGEIASTSKQASLRIGAAIVFANYEIGTTEDLEPARRHLESALASVDARTPELPKVQAQLRLGMIETLLEERDPERPRKGLEQLQRVLSELTRITLSLRLDLVNERKLALRFAIRAAVHAEDWETARSLLVQAERVVSREPGNTGPDLFQARISAFRNRTLLAGDADQERWLAALESSEAQVKALVDHWRGREVSEQGRGLLHLWDYQAVFSEHARLAVAALGPDDGARRALDVLLRLQGIGTLARAAGAAEVTAAEVEAHLVRPERGLLFFLPGHLEGAVVCVDDAGVALFPLPTSRQLELAQRELVLSLQIGLFLPSEADALRIEDAVRVASGTFLPTDLRQRMADWRELVIVGPDALGYVPFEALHWDASETVGERFAVSYLPSAPIAIWMDGRRPSSPPGTEPLSLDVAVHLAAIPDAATGDEERLTFGGRERTRLLQDCTLGEPELHVGDLVTLDWFRRDRRERDLLHVIAHGEAPRGRFFGLRLADGVLTPAEARALSLPAYVFVTACETWRGPIRRGDDGYQHFPASLFLAGARGVVVSSTELDYALSLDFMASVYKELSRGNTVAGALQSARCQHRDSTGAGVHPIHASLFHAVGLVNDPLREPVVIRDSGPSVDPADAAPRAWSWWPWIVGLVVVGGVVWFGRRLRR